MKKLIATLIFLLLNSYPAYAETMEVNVINVPDVNVTNIIPSAPNQPQNVTVSGITDTQANVSWEASDGATQYMIYLNGTQVMGSNSPGVTIDGLMPNSSYEIYIVANNAGGSSPASSPVYFDTLPIAPTMPEQPLVRHMMSDSISLTWSSLPETQEITTYRIYLDGKVYQDIEPDSGGFQSVTLTNLEIGDHTVNISGVNDNKEGPLSKTLTFTISALFPPAEVKMFNHGTDAVWLSWEPVLGAKNYLVSIDGQVFIETYDSKIKIENLEPGSTYQIAIEALSETGNKSIPTSVEVKTLPIPDSLNKSNLFMSINNYLPNVAAYVEVIFVVVATVLLAKQLKISLI